MMYEATRTSDYKKIKQEAYLEAIENTLEEVRNGTMEFVSININREIETIKDGGDIVGMEHTGIITLEITLRPARK